MKSSGTPSPLPHTHIYIYILYYLLYKLYIYIHVYTRRKGQAAAGEEEGGRGSASPLPYTKDEKVSQRGGGGRERGCLGRCALPEEPCPLGPKGSLNRHANIVTAM
jgi:hypothetical protein